MPLPQKHIDETGAETLSQSDKLYVVHVKQGKDSKERAWSAGGPVLPSLQLALAHYPHTIVELEVQSFALCLARKIAWPTAKWIQGVRVTSTTS